VGMRETLTEVLKDLVLPELDTLKGEVGKLGVRLDAVEKRLEDFNGRFQGMDQHLIDQSRRIDETNQRIDVMRAELIARIDKVNADLTARIDKVNADLTARIDQQGVRIDGLTAQVVTLGQEVAALRRDGAVMADVLRRLARLEDKVAA